MSGTAPSPYRRIWIALACFFLSLALLVLAVLHWGGYLLMTRDVLPLHADGAIILQASLPSENARIAGAVQLLQEGTVGTVLLSIPEHGYWGQSFPDIAHTYLEKRYGPTIGNRFGFCVTGLDVDSTEQEARALVACIEEHHWHSFIVVTSNFHGRRAGMIWRRVCKRSQASFQIWVDGAKDASFQPAGWWRHRLYAKTWFFESTKLVWEYFSG